MTRVASLYQRCPLDGSTALYERLKAEFNAAVPGATPQQYTQAMQAAAKAAGI